MRVPFSAASVGKVRHRLAAWLDENDLADVLRDDALLVLSELIANSVRHASPLSDGSIEVSWEADGDDLEIVVSDGGSPTRPRTVAASSSALAGRGLAIVDALALRWSAEQEPSRATVRTVLPL